MKIIECPNEFIKQKLTIPEPSDSYRWSNYIIKLIIGNFILLYNGITSAIVRLTNREYENGLKNKKLREMLFVVPQDYPEYEIYQYLRSIIRPNIKFDIEKTLYSYTILNTTKCNARCKYCFENDEEFKTTKQHMDDHTIDNLLKLIQTNYDNNGKDVVIGLFGGEPFFHQKSLDRIFNYLKDHNIRYKSNFISNGYLINEKMIDKLIDLYHCTNGQITLDGTEETYNSIKNYIYKNGPSPYKVVLENIDRIINTGKIGLSIRVNYDPRGDYSSQLEVAKIMSDKYGHLDNVKVYIHEYYRKDYTLEEQEKMFELYKKYSYETVYSRYLNVLSNLFIYEKCMSDSGQSIVISPNGDLYKCEDMPKGGKIGNLNEYFDNGTPIDIELMNKFYFDFLEFEECKKCNIKPFCIKLEFCPEDDTKNCSLIKKYKITEDLNNTIKAKYEQWLKSNK